MKKQKKGGFFSEFKTFITRGNVLDMAVGVIVGGAFTAIVTALTANILQPIINWILASILGGENALEAAVTVLKATYLLDEAGNVVVNTATGLPVVDLANSIYINWGAFISAIINFILVAFVLFCIVRTINKVSAMKKAADNQLATEKEAVKKYRKEGLTKKEAVAKYTAEMAELEAAKAAEAKAAAEQAAAEAEAKATANTKLLEEIRDLLKNK